MFTYITKTKVEANLAALAHCTLSIATRPLALSSLSVFWERHLF